MVFAESSSSVDVASAGTLVASSCAGASVSVGAGCSASVPSVGSASIQRTVSPLEYVCTALNWSESTSGSGPIDTGNRWKLPGAI